MNGGTSIILSVLVKQSRCELLHYLQAKEPTTTEFRGLTLAPVELRSKIFPPKEFALTTCDCVATAVWRHSVLLIRVEHYDAPRRVCVINNTARRIRRSMCTITSNATKLKAGEKNTEAGEENFRYSRIKATKLERMGERRSELVSQSCKAINCAERNQSWRRHKEHETCIFEASWPGQEQPRETRFTLM